MAKTKLIYFFGNKKAEGNADMRAELGGKGANLAEMTNIGVPVPPGFTISTDVCKMYYDNNRKYPKELYSDVATNLAKLERAFGKKLGDENDPLLVSVRSGAASSMPGMMDTILNLGLNDKSVLGLAKKTNNPRFAWDAYRRFIQMFGDVAMGVPHEEFEKILSEAKARAGKKLDNELDTSELREIVAKYKALYQKTTGTEFPQDPEKQMWHAINAVFGSWMNARAIKYRELNNIKGLKGTAVTVMAMVFGNMGSDSGTGVCFSRSPSTGENKFFGEYLINAQGEDVVAGIRTPEEISQLKKDNPKIYDELIKIRNNLEKHYHDMQDMEFTVQQGKLYMLQCRNGKRTGPAAVKMAVDMVAEKLITKEEAILRVDADQIDQLLQPVRHRPGPLLGQGLIVGVVGHIIRMTRDRQAPARGEPLDLLHRRGQHRVRLTAQLGRVRREGDIAADRHRRRRAVLPGVRRAVRREGRGPDAVGSGLTRIRVGSRQRCCDVEPGLGLPHHGNTRHHSEMGQEHLHRPSILGHRSENREQLRILTRGDASHRLSLGSTDFRIHGGTGQR